MKRALFLDRDGVINVDSGYLFQAEEVRFVEGIFAVARRATTLGYLPIVVTNQAGVARGFYTEADVRALHQWMAQQFLAEGVAIASFYYSPYHPDGVVPEYTRESACRKPGTGMFEQADKEFGIDFSRSLMVGDRPSDRIPIEGLRSLILKSRYTKEGEWDICALEEVLPYLSE